MAKQKKQRFGDWLKEWLDDNHPGWQTDKDGLNRADVRRQVYRDVPQRYMPSLDALRDRHWVKRTGGLFNKMGLGFLGGRQGEMIVAQLALPMEDFRTLLTDEARGAATDKQAIRARACDWFAVNAPSASTTDIDLFVDSIFHAVGA